MPQSDYKVNITVTTTDKTSGPAKQAAKGMTNLQKAVKAVGIAFAAVKSAKFVAELAKMGAAAQRQEAALNNLAASAGTSGDAIIKSIRTASNFTIDRMTAMQSANRAMVMDVAQTPEEFERLTKVAVALGRAMGQDAAKSIDDFVTASARQSQMIADNLGLTVTVGAATERYAAKLGVAVDELTDAQKKQAFLNMMLEEGEKKMAALGDQTLDTAGKIEQANALISDLKTTIGVGLASALSGVIGDLGQANAALDEHGTKLSAAIRVGIAFTTGTTDRIAALEQFRDTLKEATPPLVESEKAHRYVSSAVLEQMRVTEDLADRTDFMAVKQGRAARASQEQRQRTEELTERMSNYAEKMRYTADSSDFLEMKVSRMSAAMEEQKEKTQDLIQAEMRLAEQHTSMAMRYADYQEDVADTTQNFADRRAEIESDHQARLAELQATGNEEQIQQEEEHYQAQLSALQDSQAEQEEAQRQSLGRMVLQHFDAWTRMNLDMENLTQEQKNYIIETRQAISEEYGLVTQSAIDEMNKQEEEWKRTMSVMTGEAQGFFDYFMQQFNALPDEKVIRIRTELAERPEDIARQHGGPVRRGQAYIVGERGPELFVPGSSGTVINNSRTEQIIASNNTYNIGDLRQMAFLRARERAAANNAFARSSGM